MELRLCMLRVHESSEYYYIGRFRKVLKFVHIQNGIFRVLNFVVYKFGSLALLKGSQTPLSNSKIAKVTKNLNNF